MSRTVCSWCKAPLVLKDDILVCSNTDCPACDEKYLHEELIRTRKALETIRLHLMTAKGRFNLYDEYLVSGMDSPDARFIKEEIDKALEQIKALEQKDVK